jgi:hypothetical protein
MLVQHGKSKTPEDFSGVFLYRSWLSSLSDLAEARQEAQGE